MASSSVLAGPAARVDAFSALVAGLVPHSFPSRDDVDSMAGRIAARVGVSIPTGFEGPAYRLRFSPGTVGLRSRTVRAIDSGTIAEDSEVEAALFEVEKGTGRELTAAELAAVHRRREITEWSRASRARMVETIAQLDLSGWADDRGVLAMVTLTLPGDWQAVAPTGRHFKRMVEVFRRRWTRSVGPWRGLWKLEFQGRGAPHMHMLLRVPARVGSELFEEWLSRTWAEIVAADDVDCLTCFGERGARCSILCDDSTCEGPCRGCVCAEPDTERARHLRAGTGVDFSGVKFSDPRRTSIYFAGHSSKNKDGKEYQHIVPEAWRGEGRGPGRFWGVWGLARAVGEVWVERDAFTAAKRVLRRLSRARSSAAELSRRRASGESVWSMRSPRRPGGFRHAGGWVLVNDGLTVAYDLARWLSVVERSH